MENSEKFKTEALTFPARAKGLIVYDNATLIAANEFIKTIKALRKEVAESYDPIIEKARRTRDEALAQKKKYDEPLKEAEQITKLNIASYNEEQEGIRREAEEKARKEEEGRQKKEEEALEKARKLEEAGKPEEAKAVIEDIPLPAMPPEPPPILEGLIVKKILDTERINQLVESSQGQTKIPGILIYPVWKWKIVNRELIPKTYYKTNIASKG